MRLVLAAAALVTSTARADDYAPWTLVPELSAQVAYGNNRQARSVLGAELRVRANDEQLDPSRIYTLGLGVETVSLATVEPYAAIGLGGLMQLCAECSNDARMFGAAHLGLGGGVRWTDTASAQPFALARVSAGLIMARPDGAQRFKLTSQLDVVVELAVSGDGEYRFGFGLALDPFRFFQDAVAFNR